MPSSYDKFIFLKNSDFNHPHLKVYFFGSVGTTKHKQNYYLNSTT